MEHGSFSDWSQPRSASPVASEPVPYSTESDDQLAPISEHERTDVESTCNLEDPDGPPWHVRLIQKLCRDKRLDDIPGWLDRWDVFLGVHDLAGSINSVQDDAHQAALRRRVWGWVVLHSLLVTALLALGVYVPPLTLCLRDGFHSLSHRVAIYAALIFQLMVLKLVLDIRCLRRLVFLLYSVTFAALLATSQSMPTRPSILNCCALAILPQLIVLLLCGVQRRTNVGTAVFLSHVTIGCVAATVTSVVAVTLHYGSASPGLFGDSDHLALAVLALAGVAFVGAFEASLLFRTLAPDETWLGIYCVHMDLHVTTLVTPAVLVLMTAAGVLGLAMCTPLDMLRQVYARAWDFYSGGSACGFVWHLNCWRRRRSRVGVERVHDAHCEGVGRESSTTPPT
jgi:hypothetical protein